MAGLAKTAVAAKTSEFRFIERLKRLIPRSLQGPFPIGDDAAILPAAGGKCLLFTTDVLVEGVDFRDGSRTVPEAIGHKALAVNLSDLAAMGGRPLAFVAAFGIPKNFSEAWVERVARGMVRLAGRFRVHWVGGDLSRANKFFVSIALLGEGKTKRVVRRSGAKPGDFIYVTGKLGGSILGKHLRFLPRLAESQFLAGRFRPTSMIDVSDGLIQDLEHLLSASRVGALVDLGLIPISKDAWTRSRGSAVRSLEAALTDGEDFELLFTISRRAGGRLERAWRRKFPRVPLTQVGVVTRSKTGKIEWLDEGKVLKKLWFRKKGFQHF